jgi:antitoxin FitA
MKTIEVSLPEPTAQRLEDAAERLGVTAEDLLRISVEEKLSRLDGDFSDAADYVISKNRELYKRLA